MNNKYFIIADDHQLIRTALKSTIQSTCPDCNIFEASNAQELLCILDANKQTIDLLFLDLNMPGSSSSKTIQEITKKIAAEKICIISADDNPSTIQKCKQEGVRGYIPKTDTDNSLISIIKKVIEGGSYFPILTKDPNEQAAFVLSAKQIMILELIAQGLATLEISAHLNLTEHAIHYHLKNIYRKTNTKNRIAAVNAAKENGLIADNDIIF